MLSVNYGAVASWERCRDEPPLEREYDAETRQGRVVGNALRSGCLRGMWQFGRFQQADRDDEAFACRV